MTLSLITALLLPPAAAEDTADAADDYAEAAVGVTDCNAEFIDRHQDDGWRPRARWERTVNVGYAQYQRVRLEAGVEYIVESCTEGDIEDLRISVYDNRAMLRIQSWSGTLTFVVPRSGDFSIGVETPISDLPPADVLLQLSSSR